MSHSRFCPIMDFVNSDFVHLGLCPIYLEFCPFWILFNSEFCTLRESSIVFTVTRASERKFSRGYEG